MGANQSEKSSIEEESLKGFKKIIRKVRNKIKELLTRNRKKDKPAIDHDGNLEKVKKTEPKTRKEQKEKQQDEKKTAKKPRRRIFPIWLRIIVVLFFSGIALIAGLMIGYGILGNGSPLDVLKMDTWQHIVDIVVKKDG